MNRDEYEKDPLTADEFSLWKKAKTTEKVMFLLDQQAKEAEKGMGEGATLSFHSVDTTAQSTARMVGLIEGLNKILHMEVEDEV